MKKKPFNQNAAIRGALRRLFARSPVVREVLSKVRREVPKFNKDGSRAKKDAVQYQCGVCHEYVGSTKVSVDHIDPVVDVNDGFIDWNTFVARLFCDASNLQVICDTCHDKKTYEERIARLLIQYTQELDKWEAAVVLWEQSDKKPGSASTLRKELSRYTSKRKTKGLETIVERAQALKDRLGKQK